MAGGGRSERIDRLVLGVTMAYRLALNFAPLPAAVRGPAWEFFPARWLVVAEWAVGRVTLPRAVLAPWVAALALGLAVLLEWHTWHYGLYTLEEPLYRIAFALMLCVALARERGRAASAIGRYFAGPCCTGRSSSPSSRSPGTWPPGHSSSGMAFHRAC